MKRLLIGLALLSWLVASPTIGPASFSVPAIQAAETSLVDLNTATAKQLMELPGVGEATAAKIVAGRPYKSVDDLEKAGLSKATIDKFRSQVFVKTAPAKETPSGGKVDLNSATAKDLMELPGVGEATAAKIIAGRPYKSVDDLEKAGLSKATIDKFRSQVFVKTAPAKEAPVGGKVDLNSATAKELMELPGVGEATAAKIIAGRPYKSVADLEKAGIPKATITKIAPMVNVKAAVDTDEATTPARTPPSPGMVWVNTRSKLFHKEGSRWYGKTKEGEFMTEANAVKWGATEAKQ